MEKKRIRTNNFIKEILSDPRIPENIGLNRCIQCGNCSASCPAARYTSYRPRKIIQDILNEERNNLLTNDDIWLCYSCFSCNLRCPRNNNPGIIIHVLRKMALEKGYGWEKIIKFRSYLESLRELGIGVSRMSFPREFFQELGDDWINIQENMPNILRELNMNPNNPRELPKEAKEQIKKILELAGINEDIEKIKEQENINKNSNEGDE